MDTNDLAVTPADASSMTEEGALWHKLRVENDERTRHALLERHLPFARIMAAKLYANRTHDEFEFNEYLQLANVALIESIDRYDPARGAQFRTFAYYRIHGAVLNGLVHLSEKQEQISLQQRLKKDRLSLARERPQPADGSADQLLVHLSEVGIGLALGTILEGTAIFADDHAFAPDQGYRQVELKQFRQRLRSLLSQLTERETQVIQRHYLQGIPFEEIATSLGISKARVSQLHYQGLQRLHRLLASQSYDVAW